MYPLPIYVWVIVLITVIGMPATICVVLWRGAIAAGLNRRSALQISAATGIGWAGWVISSALLADADVYRLESGTASPWIGAAVIGAVAMAVLFTRIPVVRRIFADPGVLWQLTLPQTFRLVGIALVAVLALDKLPAVFALPAGLGDIALAVAAPFVARNLRRGAVGPGALWFNILGLLDVIVALGIGLAAGLGPTPLLAVAPSTQAMALLPLVLLPTTVIPLVAVLHLVSLATLRKAARSGFVGDPVARTA